MTLEQIIKDACRGKTSRDMPYRYNSLLSFGEDILADKIRLTEKEILKYLDEYDKYTWDSQFYGGYESDIMLKLYSVGMKIIEKYNLYKYIKIYHDVFYIYSYYSKDRKIKDDFEELNKEYYEWINAGKPEGKYIRWKNSR